MKSQSKILNSGLILKPFTHELHVQVRDINKYFAIEIKHIV